MQSKFNIKLLFLLLALIFLVFTIFTIRTTYARYVTSLTAGGTVELGKWLITVNTQNILDDSDLSSKIIPIFNTDSDYIAEGKIAPGSTGYVVITLDYSKVNVPFKYSISCVSDESTLLEDFILTSYSIDEGSDVIVTDPTLPVEDTILPTDTVRTRTLKLNYTWFDGKDENFDDAKDTVFSLNDELGLRFNLDFTQLQPTT